MKILVLFSLNERTSRSTIHEHLYSFREYNKEDQFHYVNIFNTIPSFLLRIKYDAIILHYTFLGEKRFLAESEPWMNKMRRIKQLQGYKIAIPQDEYDFTDRLCELFKESGIDILYTCFTNHEDIEKAYPFAKSGLRKIKQVFTGYIDEEKISLLQSKCLPYDQRPTDLGYRGRKLPAYLGRHGQLKYELVNVFNEALKNKKFVTDIRNTNDNFIVENMESIKLGFSWYDFLLSCKAIIGCEGGSSLIDPTGLIQKRVKEFVSLNPEASFEDIERYCFKDQDYNIKCFALSPRHFEAAMTKTLQILVEGDYGGVFKPWVHYVPLKKDFSNIDEVLIFLNNYEACEQIVMTAYNDIVLSGNFSYRKFVSHIRTEIVNTIGESPKSSNTVVFFILLFFIEARNVILKYWFLLERKIKTFLRTNFN